MDLNNLSFKGAKQMVREFSTGQKVIVAIVIVALIGVIITLCTSGEKPGDTRDNAINVDYYDMYYNYEDYSEKFVKFAGRIETLPTKNEATNTQFVTFDEGFDDPQKCIYVTLMTPIDVENSEITGGSYVTIVGRVGLLAAAYDTNSGDSKGILNILDAEIVGSGLESQNFYQSYREMASQAEVNG